MEFENEDYPNIEIPPCVEWTVEEVGSWIKTIGFPHYKEAFEKNFISGRKLVLLVASHFPKMGITNFEDIKVITAAIRNLFNTKLITHDRSIAYHRREPWALYLEEHSKTGKTRKPNYSYFLKMRGMMHTEP